MKGRRWSSVDVNAPGVSKRPEVDAIHREPHALTSVQPSTARAETLPFSEILELSILHVDMPASTPSI
jgi:hypothetical protein